jgi:hypothetical protein
MPGLPELISGSVDLELGCIGICFFLAYCTSCI